MEHLRRHGCADRGSYRKEEWEPYQKAAREWLRDHRKDPEVLLAIARLDSLMSSAGRSKSAHEHAAAVPKEKARIVLARLYEAGKTGEQLFEIALTIKAACFGLGPWGWPEWEPVQIAKLAKRLRGASGTRYPSDLFRLPPKYPRAAGIFMSILGRKIRDRARIAITSDILEEIGRRARAGRPTIVPPTNHPPHGDDLRDELKRLEEFRSLIGGGGGITYVTD